jgi:hypothetical protein
MKISAIHKLKRFIFAVIISIFLTAYVAPAQTEEQKKNSISEFVTRAGKNFMNSKKDFSVKTKNRDRETIIENFSYSMNNGKIEVLKVSFQDGILFFEEEFFIRNGEPVFVYEKETATKDGEVIHEWSGEHYLEDGKLFNSETNGHGKSETGDWEPEKEIPKLYRKRIKQLNKFL